ncbi:MAG: rhomboid family intramembrane serine protease [Spirochaetales bacterium]|nr:rhomboid family intramembrane serine protease [Spirochaetales bacterium]
MKLSIKYNAPLTLTYTLLATTLLLLDSVLGAGLTERFFLVPGRGNFTVTNPIHYFTLVSYVLGHANWTHLMSNLAFILLIGPILEEKHGSFKMFTMVLITALATGILNVLVFPNALLGGSGIVFMMIILASFTNIRNGELPLTFILIFLIYLTTEIMNAFEFDNISQFAHIMGGILGSVFGFLRTHQVKHI